MKNIQINFTKKLTCILIASVFAAVTVFYPVAGFAEDTGSTVSTESKETSTEPSTENADGKADDKAIQEQEKTQTETKPVVNEENEEKTNGKTDSREEAAAKNEKAAEPDRQEPQFEAFANSWRYKDGYLIDNGGMATFRARAAFKPWSKSDKGYISSDGTVISGAKKKGIDVSEWQGKINWSKVKKSGIDFAIIRCGYGSNYTDQDDAWWKYNVSECERLGIPYGVYLYSCVNTAAKAKSEANHVLRLLKGHKPTYPVYYDLEDATVAKAGRTNIIKYAQSFCSTIEANGYRAGIYANLDWWDNKLNSSTLDKYEKWIAQWNNECEYEGDFGIWQCTDSGTVSGIDGNVDLNFAFTEYSAPESTGNKWIKDENGQTVFQKADGTIAVSQWVNHGGNKYYVNSTGVKVTGFKTIGKTKYYFNSKGVMQKSKWITVSGKKYYLKSNGSVATGYQKVGYYYYGFSSAGVMLKGTATISGKKYKFCSNGRAYLYTAKIKDGPLNYRTGPGTKYKRKGSLKKNKVVTVIREKSGWGMMTNGYWIKLSYTSKVTKYPLKAKVSSKPAKVKSYKVKVIDGPLNYRTGPGTKYKKKGSYKKGKIITIKSTKNGWGKMSNGYWIKLSYTRKV